MRTYDIFPAILLAVLIVAPIGVQSQTILTNGDTKIESSKPTATAGSAGWLNVNNGTHALFKFNVSAVTGPVAAELQVQIIASGVRSPGAIAVYEVVSPWNEQSVSWATRPAFGAKITSQQITLSFSGGVAIFDISSLVNQWLANPSSNNGLSLQVDGNNADVVFRSRESQGGSFVPRLQLSIFSSPVGAIATVGQNGADYTHPLEATTNLESGDQWCRQLPVPNNPPPCVIIIGPGTYELAESLVIPTRVTLQGYGPEATSLIAASGLRDAVIIDRDGGDVVIKDLAIRNEYGNGSQSTAIQGPLLNGNVELRNVSAHASGSSTNVAVQHGLISGLRAFGLTATAHGGNEATGIQFGAGSTNELRDSTVRASNAAVRNVGVAFLNRDEEGGSLLLIDSTVTALGGQYSVGLLTGPESSITRILGGTISALGADLSNTALTLFEVDNGLIVNGTEIVAGGGDAATNIAVALFRDRPSEEIRLSSISAVATGGAGTNSAALFVDYGGSGVEVYVSDSSLTSRNIAVRATGMQDRDEVLRIFGSVLSGEVAAVSNESNGDGIIRVSHSLLDGAIVEAGAATVACAAVTDNNSVFYPDSCP